LTREERMTKRKFGAILSEKEKEFPFYWNNKEFRPEK
jgi:hypothetical protein